MIGIYKFTNKITGESYIGQSVNLRKRYNDHKNIKEDGTYFHQMIKHYGFNNFNYEILEECKSDNLNEREKYYISKYKTVYPNGYNLTYGGNDQHCNGLSSKKDVDEITELLMTSKLSNKEIGDIYGVSDQAISDINCGRTWVRDHIEYPIRKTRHCSANKYCSECGSPIYKYNKSGLCRSCFNKSKQLQANAKRDMPDKDTLYDLLCDNSFLMVASKYGVTDNAVRKWCDKTGIPRHSSYYRKLKAS